METATYPADSAPVAKTKATRARIALAGNPNCGKTTIFNALTGLHYKVANYPGVTVEKKEGAAKLSATCDVQVLDLPGIYSLCGSSIDERIATQILTGDYGDERKPDLVVSVLDSANLERNLYLTTQLIDLGLPVVVALNMMDLAERGGISIKKELLASALDVPVVSLNASKGAGLEELKRVVEQTLTAYKPSTKQFCWLPICSPYRDAAQELGTLEVSAGGNLPAILKGAALLADERPPSTLEIATKLAAWKKELALKNIDGASFEATSRYQIANWIYKRCVSVTRSGPPRLIDRVDGIIMHRIWGVVTFMLVMALIFQAIFLWASAPMDLIDSGFTALGSFIKQQMDDGPLRSLLVDGVIAGVGGVLIFIPQIAILFFFLGLLEDSGYLARAAFIMDRIMRQFGLQGRSFIPLLSSFACAIPGIMSTRTIPSFADRMVTILVAPLMSCSARLPVYTLLISAFIPNTKVFGFISMQGLVLLGMYLLGIIGAAIVAWLLKLSVLRGTPALFIMEMPVFKVPGIKLVLRDVWDRIVLFIKGAGTVILACSILLWFLAAYPQGSVKESYAGQIGTAMEPLIKPLGFNWEIGVGILASFAAREVFVTSLATVYNLQDADDTSQSLISMLQQRHISGEMTTASALSLMVFFVFACQCMSTIAVCRRETGSWRWPVFMFIYMTALAYGAAWVMYTVARGLGW
jgi:ferrous iron transport protein B